jgi:hypothetical protein
MSEAELHRLIARAVFVATYVGLGIGGLPRSGWIGQGGDHSGP